MCTDIHLLATHSPSTAQGMDLMVLPERMERLEWPGIQASGGRLVLVHLDLSAADAHPTPALVFKARCCPLL